MSGLDFQTVPIDFRGAMDQKTNRKLLPAGKWTALRDCAQAADYALKLRDGVGTLVESADGNSLATLDNELLVINGPSASTIGASGNPFNVVETASATAVSGEVGCVEVTHEPVLRNMTMQATPDCSHGREHTAYVWMDLSATGTVEGVSVAVRNEKSGAFVIAPTRMRTSANVFSPRVVYSAGTFFICYREGNNLYGRGITVSAAHVVGSISAEQTLVSSASFSSRNIDMDRFVEDESTDLGRVAVTLPWAVTDSLQVVLLDETAGVPGVLAGPVTVFTVGELAVADFNCATLCWMNTPSDSGAGILGVFACGNTGTLAGTAGRFFDDQLVPLDAAFQVDTTVGTTVTGVSSHITALGQDGNNLAVVVTDQQAEWSVADAVVPVRRNVVNWTGAVSQAGTASTIINSATFNYSATTPAGPQGPFIFGKLFANAQFVSGTVASPIWQTGALMLPMCVMENWQGLGANVVNLNQQSTMFLLDATSGVILTKALYGRFGVPAVNNNVPRAGSACGSPEIIDDNTGVTTGWGTLALERTNVNIENGLQVTPTGLSRLTWIPRAAFADTPLSRSLSATQLGPVAYVGDFTQFDTQRFTEVGFPLFPEGVSVVNVAGGGSVSSGSHALCAVYEWLDGAGQRHQSAPSTPVSVTSAANDSIRVRIPTMLLSQKPNISLVIYMTESNQQTLKRVSTVAAPTANVTTAAYVSVLVTESDTTISGNELLYTQPLLGAATTLANVAPNPCSVMCVHQNRLFVDRSDTQGGYAFSQKLVSGVGLQWNETLSGAVPADAGRIVNLVSMDEKLVILCERGLFYIVGTGPLPTGEFDNYSEPIAIPSDVGCSERRSVVLMPMGIVFLTPKGFYLLRRDLTLQDIGEGVEALTQLDTVQSATLLESKQELRFGGDSFQLTYSYVPGQWSYSVVTENPGTSTQDYAVADARWWPVTGTYVTVSNTQSLNTDVSGQQFDSPNGATPVYFGMFARTSFIHLSALEGFQRVRRLNFTTSNVAAVNGDFTLVVDFDDLYQDVDPAGAPGSYTTSFDLTTYGATATGVVTDLRHKLHRQKCKSVAFTFETTPDGNATNITGMEALALEIGVKQSSNKLPAANSIT